MAIPQIRPTTITRLAYGAYPSMAMLAGMQLDVFTPLKDGPLRGAEIARAIGVGADRLEPLLYALVHAELLTVEDGRFANTPEADLYLVRGRPTYMGSAHEAYADLWNAALGTARSIRAGAPQAKHDFEAMSDDELGAFFRGQHAGALATGRQLAHSEDFARFRRLLDVGGGSGGLAIGACEVCAGLAATVVELPRVAAIARGFVAESAFGERIRVLDTDVTEVPPAGSHDIAVLRNLLQVLSPDQCRRVLRNVGRAAAPGGMIYIVGHILEDSRIAPAAAVGFNLVFLNVYDAGRAHSEGEHRSWLAEAGFADAEVRYRVAPGDASILVARKPA